MYCENLCDLSRKRVYVCIHAYIYMYICIFLEMYHLFPIENCGDTWGHAATTRCAGKNGVCIYIHVFYQHIIVSHRETMAVRGSRNQ